MSTSIT